MKSLNFAITNEEQLSWLRRLRRQSFENKSHCGRLVLLGGQSGMVGAVFLAGRTALFSGAGWVILGILAQNAPCMDMQHPELMCLSAQSQSEVLAEQMRCAQTLAIGPGLGQNAHAAHWLKIAMRLDARLVLDADALNLLATDAELLPLMHMRHNPISTLMTPHPGEAARLLGVEPQDIQRNRLESARALAEKFHCLVVLKGEGTWCVAPKALSLEPIQCQAGNAGMASAGMGDALTGLIAALSAQGVHHGLDLWQASVLGVELHARAADELSVLEFGPVDFNSSEDVLDSMGGLQTLKAAPLNGLQASELGPVIRSSIHLALNPKAQKGHQDSLVE